MKGLLFLLLLILFHSCSKKIQKAVDYSKYNGKYQGYIYSEKYFFVYDTLNRYVTFLDTLYVEYDVKITSAKIIIDNTPYSYYANDSTVFHDSLFSSGCTAHYGKDNVILDTKNSILFHEYVYNSHSVPSNNNKYIYWLKKKP